MDALCVRFSLSFFLVRCSRVFFRTAPTGKPLRALSASGERKNFWPVGEE